METQKLAALYVLSDGPYSSLLFIDPWDIKRDARKYGGPFPVIAHPPCERWGRYWSGGPSAKVRRKLGDDNGCFEAALKSVRQWGGVLEHPEASHAWTHFGLNKPPKSGGWINADFEGGWTCCVEQGHYGHKARKATWLYAKKCDLSIPIIWGKAPVESKIDEGYHSAEERRRAIKTGICQRLSKRLSKRQRMLTPNAFRDLLINLVQWGHA